ncbi:SMI1/KNR4 family protein [Dyella sp.]|jgi:hypothetical protein|uniref:SMI1/KNR4 family protein n=1 Tax=Dyella sp. TaxID=1869338 RepID=UPI002FD8C047
MDNPITLRDIFREYSFGEPATPEMLDRAEAKLGHALPPVLLSHFLAFNGFKGPTAADFFYSVDQLVEMTLFFRSEDYFPGFLDTAVAFGDDGTGPCWLIRIDQPDTIIEWDAEWGEHYDVLPGSIADVWLARKAAYDRIAARAP